MRRELLPLLKIAGPVVLAEIGWMSMGIVDTLMVGPLGPAAIGAVGMGSGIFTAIAIFGMGLMLGLDTLVSQAYGARRLDECLSWLHHGIALALVAAPLVMGIVWTLLGSLDGWGIHPEIRILVGPYLQAISFGALPLLLYASFRRYLQGLHLVRPVMFALLSANLVNAAGNWILIHGHFGMPALGAAGSAWATTLARTYMATFLLVAIRLEHRRRGTGHPLVAVRIDPARMRRLVSLGLPAASQVAVEVGVFAAATALAARLDPISAGAHQIALNIASLAFMVPLGLGSASAVRVGHAIGAGERPRAARAGWTAMFAGGAVMLAVGVIFFLVPEWLLRPFSSDPQLLAIGSGLLGIAAFFQLFDGTQAVLTGVLRGAGDTRTAMFLNVIGHWAFGLPIGYALCFWYGWGVGGLWIGLSLGLVFVSVVLTAVWMRRARELT